MSLQWTLIASFLYIEIVIVLLLTLPVASPKRWNTLFKSKFLQGIQRQAGVYFFVLLAILVLFLLDAIREMNKYSGVIEHEEAHTHLDQKMQGSMRLFRAQRNFYISGFSLFLSLVIRRLVILISSQACLLAQNEASMKQAESATSAAKSLLNEKTQNEQNEDNDINALKSQLQSMESKYQHELKDKETLKKQCDNLAKEFDKLADEHSKLQKTFALRSGDDESKKEN